MLIQATQAFIFKERRLASLIWLWGVLGTLIVFFAVDYLANSFVIGPSYYGEVFWLIPIYYFFTLYLCYLAYGSGLKAFISAFFQFIGQMAVLIIIMSFWGVYSIFMTTDYQENKLWQEEEAPSIFTEDTKLDYPNDAELIHTSLRKWGANGSKNIVFRVDDINSFGRKAFERYEFDNLVMDFPNLGRSRLGESNGNVLLPPFCREFSSVTVVPRYLEVTREVTDPEDFCGERDALFTQIDYDTEIGVIMVILPKEKLVWLNSTGWF
jgi:hypothetical protein